MKMYHVFPKAKGWLLLMCLSYHCWFPKTPKKNPKHGPRSIWKQMNLTGFKAELNVDDTSLKFN